MPSPEISIVVPAYNEEKLIRNTLNAVTRQKTDASYGVVVVDNASTDDTPNIVADYPTVKLLQEPTKGTGFAANTGFRCAIDDNGSALVMRTDGDTVPAVDWVESARHYLSARPRRQLISGLIRPLHDEYYKPYDELILPISYVAYRFGVTALRRTLWPLRVARGGNMAIRAAAFDSVGGFPDSSIDEQDDDLELTRRVYGEYGLEGLGNVHNMLVRTSMRRIRQTGYLGLANYYLTSRPLQEVRNKMMGGRIDSR